MSSIENDVLIRVYYYVKYLSIDVKIPNIYKTSFHIHEFFDHLENEGLSKKAILKEVYDLYLEVRANGKYLTSCSLDEFIMDKFYEVMSKYVKIYDFELDDDIYYKLKSKLFEKFGELDNDNVLIFIKTNYGYILYHLDVYYKTMTIYKIETDIQNINYIISYYVRRKKCACGKYHYYSFTILLNNTILYKSFSPYELEKVWLS